MMAPVFSRAGWRCTWYMIQVNNYYWLRFKEYISKVGVEMIFELFCKTNFLKEHKCFKSQKWFPKDIVCSWTTRDQYIDDKSYMFRSSYMVWSHIHDLGYICNDSTTKFKVLYSKFDSLLTSISNLCENFKYPYVNRNLMPKYPGYYFLSVLQNDLIHAWGLDRQLGYCAQVIFILNHYFYLAFKPLFPCWVCDYGFSFRVTVQKKLVSLMQNT